jgi:hypothetical protein
MEKHDVDIAPRIQLPATVTTQSDQTHGKRSIGIALLCRRTRGLKYVPQENVDQGGATGADLTAAAAGLMAQAQPMVLDFQKSLIDREKSRGVARRSRQFAARVLDHLVLVA